MPVTNKRAPRGRLPPRKRASLADGAVGTIAGPPMQPIELVGILQPGCAGVSRGVSRGGAVSGAAQVALPFLGGDRDQAIALSDGSSISFASIVDTGFFGDDDVTVAADAKSGRRRARGTSLV
jgi:hypothetical protein